MTVVYAEPINFFLELEPLYDGVPRVRLTVYNVPDTQRIRVVRKAGGESWTVPGVRSAEVTDTGVFTDWFCPFNTNVSYTVLVEGVEQYAGSVVLESAVAWLQDPLQPNKAVPVTGADRRPDHLTLTADSLQAVQYGNQTNEHLVMGAKYPTVMGGQRQGASNVDLVASSYERSTDAAFRELVREAPVLVLRTTGEQHPLPPLCYLNAAVTEQPTTVHYGGELARWQVSGNLVAAVTQAVAAGMITYAQVQELLTPYTYAEVQEAAKSSTYLDWQKNPLIFTTL